MLDSAGCTILRLLEQLFGCPKPPAPKPKTKTTTIVVVIGPEQPRTEGPSSMATDVTLAPRKQRAIDITDIKDDDGDTVTFDGPVAWVSSDDAISDVRVQDPDGLHILVGSFDEVGAADITGTGDRRKGPEVVPAIISLHVIVSRVLGDVDSFNVSVGEEVDRVD